MPRAVSRGAGRSRSRTALEALGEQLRAQKVELGGEDSPPELAALANRGGARTRNGDQRATR